jgi:hypothetical protein
MLFPKAVTNYQITQRHISVACTIRIILIDYSIIRRFVIGVLESVVKYSGNKCKNKCYTRRNGRPSYSVRLKLII